MNDQTEKLDIDFYKLVLSMQAAAWQQLGKAASPLSGEVERNLEAARQSIDILEMIHRKTKGNLSGDEQKLLDQVLHDLRLNYVDEAKKGDQAPTGEAESGPAPEPAKAEPAGGDEAKTEAEDGKAKPEADQA